MKNVAIIPARGGSKRIPSKNIKEFLGKPIIGYSIEAAKQSGLFEKIVVSTDSKRIAEVANRYGAETPFMRPEEIADDFTTTATVLAHALQWLAAHSSEPQYACCIYATAPFIQVQYLQEGYELLTSKGAASVFPVTTFPFSIFRALKINGDGRLAMFWPQYELTRSNDLPEAYHDAGQFYWVDCKVFLQKQQLYSDDSLPVVVPRHLVQDIDTPEDWTRAEMMYKALQQ